MEIGLGLDSSYFPKSNLDFIFEDQAADYYIIKMMSPFGYDIWTKVNFPASCALFCSKQI